MTNSSLLDRFQLKGEKEDFDAVSEQVLKGVEFRGTNLLVLVFAIFIASLGLNVNSTAVIIGAMLVSPLMGPIVGIGLGLSTNDFTLLRKALYNFIIAAGISLATSTVYFSITPLNEAHSEILARTLPNIYDVLIAFFGGLAGMVAASSKVKGNVVPGVAIATALMPPLCTAGYGIATLQWRFFLGASYLFLINTVFIALATMLVARLLRFPARHLTDPRAEKRARQMVWLVTLITISPSIYFGYDVVRRDQFRRKAEAFVEKEAEFRNDYLLSRKIDPGTRSITLTYGGEYIRPEQVDSLRAKLNDYALPDVQLDIRQGFSYLTAPASEKKDDLIQAALLQKDREIIELKQSLDSVRASSQLAAQLYQELKIQYPQVRTLVWVPTRQYSDSSSRMVWQAVIGTQGTMAERDRKKMEDWLKVRTAKDSLVFSVEPLVGRVR